MGADLRQQALSLVFGGLAEEHGTKTQATTDRLFEDTSAFDRAIAIRSGFAACEGFSELLDESIVSSLDTPQTALMASSVGSLHFARSRRKSYSRLDGGAEGRKGF